MIHSQLKNTFFFFPKLNILVLALSLRLFGTNRELFVIGSWYIVGARSNTRGLRRWFRWWRICLQCRGPGLGRSPEEKNDYPLQYSCLENSMDWEVWWATVRGVTELDTTDWLTNKTQESSVIWGEFEDITAAHLENVAAAAAAAAKSLQSCLTQCDPIDGSPPGSPVLGILQARTRVGCHFLLQCMKVKSESAVARLCLTLSDPRDCSLPGSSVHGIFQARVLEWGAIAFSAC